METSMLEIACNAHKCKYEVLHTIANNRAYKYAFVFVSLNSIFNTHISMLKGTKETLSAENIAKTILDVIGHYRRFFRHKSKCESVYVFLYYGRDWLKTSSNLSLYLADFPDDNRFGIDSAVSMLNDIIGYIPGVYMIDSKDLNPGVIPYSILTNSYLKQITTRKGAKAKMISINVSRFRYDWYTLNYDGLSLGYDTMASYVVRSSTSILNMERINSEIIFPRLKKNPFEKLITWKQVYSIFLMSRTSQLSLFKGCTLAQGSEVRRRFAEASREGSIEKLNNLRKFIESDTQLDEADKIINIPRIARDNALILQNREKVWKKDLVDFSIQDINETIFKNYRIDLKSLLE